MKKIVAMLVLAGAAAAASAQGLSGQGTLTFQVSADNGATWQSAVGVTPGTSVLVRAQAGWQTTANVHGFAGVTLEEVNFANADASDGMSVSDATSAAVSDGTLFKRQAFAQAWNVYNTGTGRKLDAATNPETTGRIVFGQAAQVDPLGNPNPRYSTENPFLGFVYRFTAGNAGRLIEISGRWFRSSTPSVLGNQFVVYTTSNGSNAKFATEAAQEGAVVRIVPAPASLALIGLGGLVAGRRRR